MSRFSHNVLFNQLGFIVSAGCAFVISPITVRALGNESYGIWSLLISFSGHYGLLTFGLQSALSRYLAYSLAQKDDKAVNGYFNTALAALGVSALIAVCAGGVIAFSLEHFFIIPAARIEETRLTCIVISFTAGMTFLTAPFNGVLVGARRFGLVNMIGISSTLVRTLLVYLLLKQGYGILHLALLTLGMTMAVGLFQIGAVRFAFNRLAMGWQFITRACFRDLVNFGLKAFTVNFAVILVYQCDLIVIGVFLPPERITIYSLGLTLITYYIQLINSGVGVLTTHLVGIFAGKGISGVRDIFLPVSTLLFVIAGVIVSGCIIYGESFYLLWMGPEYSEAAWFMVLLMVPQFFATGTRICTSLLIATNTIGPMAKFAIVEGIFNLFLSLVLVQFLGLKGVAWGTMIPNMINSLVILPWLALGQVKIPLRTFFYKALCPGLITWTVGMAVGYLSLSIMAAEAWLTFGMSVAMTTLLMGGVSMLVLKLWGIRLKALLGQLT